MGITAEALEALEEAAKQATQGEWRYRQQGSMQGFVEAKVEGSKMPYGLEVLGEDYTGFGDDEQRELDCMFVALANPSMILELVRELKATRALRSAAEDAPGAEVLAPAVEMKMR